MESLTNSLFEIAEIELSYKSKVKPSLRPKITSSHEAYQVLKENWDESKIEFIEQFQILLMNRANRVLGIYRASTGTTIGCVIDPKGVFVAALKANACGVILAHNHPSGNLTPSQPDIDLTRRMVEAGNFLEIKVLDHIILTAESYFSFADEGRL